MGAGVKVGVETEVGVGLKVGEVVFLRVNCTQLLHAWGSGVKVKEQPLPVLTVSKVERSGDLLFKVQLSQARLQEEGGERVKVTG